MANALAPMMPAPHKMALPSSGLQTPEYLSPTAPVPPPVAPRAMPNALAAPNAYMGAPKKPQNEMLGAAVRGFQRGFDPAGFEQQRAQGKADALEKQKQTLALMQQQRQLPEEQRTQWWQQNAGTIGEIIGQDISQQQVDPAQFSDQALDGQIAALSGQLGIAPATPEPMSAYQREQVRLEELKMQQPRNQFIQGPDGAIAVGNLNDGTIKTLQPGQPKPDPANYDMVTTADGVIAVNKRNPNDKIRIGAAPPKTGSGGATNPAGLTEDQMKTEIQLADKWDKVAAEWQDVTNMSSRAKAMGARADSVGDLQLTIALTKLADPGTAAREGEVELTQQTASLVSQAQNWIEKLQKGNTLLPPEVRKAMLDAVGEMEGVYSDFYSGVGERTKARVEQYGLDPRRVFLTMQPNSMREQDSGEIMRGIDEVAASPTGSGAVPAEAAADLMRDPSPEAVAEFDDVFGAGMAQRVLNGSR